MDLYHYTSGFFVACILNDGKLRPRPETKGVRPALWFTESPDWDPTASCPLEPQIGVDWGRWRFVVDHRHAPWTFTKFSHEYPRRARALAKDGMRRGADPKAWRYRLTPLACRECKRLERFCEGAWVSVNPYKWVVKLCSQNRGK